MDNPLKILVVDDEEMNRRMMQLILSHEKHDVQIATGGQEAIDAVKEQDFDIILMDIQMPMMDGVETSKRIRNLEDGGKRAYIIALTASFLPEMGERLFAAGMDTYLAKPFDVQHLREVLKLGFEHKLPSYTDNKNAAAKRLVVSSEVLDLSKGIAMVGGDKETYLELLGDFVDRLPERLKKMEVFLKERNAVELSRAAHNIKGVSANLGALQLSHHAGVLEKEAGEGYTPNLIERFQEFDRITRKFVLDVANLSDL